MQKKWRYAFKELLDSGKQYFYTQSNRVLKCCTTITAILLLHLVCIQDLRALDLKSLKQPHKPGIADFTKRLEKERAEKLKQAEANAQGIANTLQPKTEKADTKAWVLSVDAKSKELLKKKFSASPTQTCQDSTGLESWVAPSFAHSQLDSSSVDSPSFYIFVSLNMKEKNLKSFAREAARYGGVMVIRGLKNDSMIDTVSYLQNLLKDKHEGVIIDPNLFRKYKIDKVPSFVVTKNCPYAGCVQQYDIIRGNITPRFALSQIKSKGDLKEEAGRLLR